MLAFIVLSTQWRIVPVADGAIYQGLIYEAIPAVLRMLGLRGERRIFAGLRVMEAAVVRVMNARRRDG